MNGQVNFDNTENCLRQDTRTASILLGFRWFYLSGDDRFDMLV